MAHDNPSQQTWFDTAALEARAAKRSLLLAMGEAACKEAQSRGLTVRFSEITWIGGSRRFVFVLVGEDGRPVMSWKSEILDFDGQRLSYSEWRKAIDVSASLAAQYFRDQLRTESRPQP